MRKTFHFDNYTTKTNSKFTIISPKSRFQSPTSPLRKIQRWLFYFRNWVLNYRCLMKVIKNSYIRQKKASLRLALMSFCSKVHSQVLTVLKQHQKFQICCPTVNCNLCESLGPTNKKIHENLIIHQRINLNWL